jgi:hypothetical protein
MIDIARWGSEEVVISKEVVEGAAQPLYIYADRADRGATRVHRSTKPCTACKTLIHHKANAPYQGLSYSPKPRSRAANMRSQSMIVGPVSAAAGHDPF